MSPGLRRLIEPSRVAHAHEHGHAAKPARHDPPGGGRSAARQFAAHAHAPRPLVALRADGPAPDPAVVGRKAASLAWLATHGARVPAAVGVPADVAERVAAGDTLTREVLAGALHRWLAPGSRYAVRSSADVEDGIAHSYAGQFETRLDVAAADVLGAIAEVAGTDDGRRRAYAAHHGLTGPVRVAVVVQEMVAAESAGVAFSRNPLTGLDEVVVEAVPGSGEALVGEGVTPDRWVRRWGAFTAEPAKPRVPTSIAEAVARETTRLGHLAGHPLDLEWAHDGTTLWWLQARPLTGLDGLRLFSNRIAREVLPGVIKPLVWSVNVPIVNAAWIDLLEELVGPLDIRPEDLARQFGYRAYFDMTTLGEVFAVLGMPRESLELLLGLPRGPEAPRFRPTMGTFRYLPRMVAVAGQSLRRGRWARAEVADLRAAYGMLAAVDPATLDERQLLDRVDALTVLTRRAAYANIVVPLLMHGYGRALDRVASSAGLDPADLDPAAARPDRRAWDPNAALDELRVMVDALPPATREALRAEPLAALDGRADVVDLHARIDRFVERFGHLSDSGNDFSVPPWREDRARIVRMVLDHPPRPERTGGDVTLDMLQARLTPLLRPVAPLLWRRAGAFRVYREAVSSTYTRGYGLFRDTFLALGTRFVDRGLLDSGEDILFLTLPEVRTLVDPGVLANEPARDLVGRRRQEVEEAADLIVPDLVFGDAFVPRRRDEVTLATLTGIPASRGSARGPARVVRGVADLDRVQQGDIIIIPYSDVGWTPLFARAAGVVAEAGGLLSHASIVAREYGIPCVVSVTNACTSVPDGAMVIVDGVNGVVLVEDREPAA